MTFEEPDNCSCFKRKDWGQYGEGGYHMMKLDLNGATRMLLDKLIGEYRRVNGGSSPDPKKEQEFRETARGMAHNYVGTVYAYERCPRYEEAHKRHIEKIRSERRAERKGTRRRGIEG